MTENTTTTDQLDEPAELQPVVPAGVDPIDGLTVNELDIASRQLRCDVYEAVGGKDGLRWAALARLAWLWAKRTDTHAKLATFTEMTGAQLTGVLRLDEHVDAGDDVDLVDDEDPAANPTVPGPAS